VILFYFLIWIMAFTNHPLWDRHIAGFTLFYYIGTACAIYALFHLSSRKTLPNFFQTWQLRLLIVLYLIATVSYFTQPLARNWSASPFLTYTSLVLLVSVAIIVIDTSTRLRRVLMAAVGSVGFSGLYILREWQKDRGSFPGLRPGWVVGDPNTYAIGAMLCLPLAFYLMMERRPAWERVYCLCCSIVTLAAVMLGASRGGFLGLSVAFLLAALKSRRPFRTLALVSVLLIPTILILPQSPLRRLFHPDWVDNSAVVARQVAWNGGLHMIKAHPLFGVGLGNFKPLVVQYESTEQKVQSVAHNSYIEIGAELGLPALGVFLALLIAAYLCLEKVRRQAVRSGARLYEGAAAGIQSGLVGYCVGAFFCTAQYEKLLWLLIGVSVCLPALARSATAKHRQAAELRHPAPAEVEVPGIATQVTSGQF
jgi:O-antigen ligase